MRTEFIVLLVLIVGFFFLRSSARGTMAMVGTSIKGGFSSLLSNLNADPSDIIKFIFLVAFGLYLFRYDFLAICNLVWMKTHGNTAGLIIFSGLLIVGLGYKHRWVLYVTIVVLGWYAISDVYQKNTPPHNTYEDITLPADGKMVQATIPAGYRYSSTEHCEGAVITFSGPSVYGGHKPLDCYGHVISEAELPGTVIRYEMPMGEDKKIRVWYTIME